MEFHLSEVQNFELDFLLYSIYVDDKSWNHLSPKIVGPSRTSYFLPSFARQLLDLVD